ncbi:hypothetical protein OESDEN_00571, partial [Oesophagostomum dentatum]
HRSVCFRKVYQIFLISNFSELYVQVDILVSIFTLESACQTYTEYCNCVKNMLKHLRSGGRFVLGSVLEEDSYNSGKNVCSNQFFRISYGLSS